MATKPSTTKAPTTQMNTWEAEMAKAATVAAKAESKSIDRPFISMGSGKMSLGGSDFPLDGNGHPHAAVIVLDQIHANLYYAGPYDANNPTSPDCYAYGAVDEVGDVIGVDTWDSRGELAPHKSCPNRQHTDCATCPWNQFGSAPQGKGKACQNTRRVGLIPAGTFVDGRFQAYTKVDQIENAQVAWVKLPTMSVKGFSTFITTVANALSMPTWGIFAELIRVPDAKAQYVANWQALGKIPNALMEAVYKRFKEVREDIAFPFAPKSEAAPAPSKAPAKRKYAGR